VPKDQTRRSRPARTPQAIADQAARQQREAAALRANLKKRKEQARARGESKDSADRA
jgi:predicted transcriptional regulator